MTSKISLLVLCSLAVSVSVGQLTGRQSPSLWSQLRERYGVSNGSYIAFSLQVYTLQRRPDLLRAKLEQMKSSGQLRYLCRYVKPEPCSSISTGQQTSLFLYIVQNLALECCTKVTPTVVNGMWGVWGRWSRCSVTCGQGTRSRTRQCDHPPPSGGGRFCTGLSFEVLQCPYVPCQTVPTLVNGMWGEWGRWSRCSVTCGRGTRSRTRQCDHPPPSNGGRGCAGYRIQYTQCPPVPCPTATPAVINGMWGEWGRWSRCSVTCGRGTRSRTRQCDHPPPSNGGRGCAGYRIQYTQCPSVPCPTVPTAVNGMWGEWGRWSRCSATCGQGTRSRTRQCDHPPPSGSGRGCVGYGINFGQCPFVPCPTVTPTAVNGMWGAWMSWSRCSVTCGQGTRSRTRQCDHPPPSGGGRGCTGNRMDFGQCVSAVCPAESRECSRTQYGNGGRVMGGTAALKGQYPWLVHLVIQGTIRCAGVIVEKTIVLTAGHCLSGFINSNHMLNSKEIEIVAGNYKRSVILEPNAQRIAVISGQRHYNYDHTYLTNDVAVLRLAKPLQFNNMVTKVCLPSKTDILPPSCVVAGWGALSYSNNVPEVLQHVELKVYDYQTCRRVFDRTTPYNINLFVMNGVMCAANGTSGGKDSCRGDSGTGLMCLANDAQGPYYKLYGLVSSGFSCGAPGQPGYYAYLPFYMDWITNFLKKS
ncbi:hypothetical protein ACOMHN_056273 [Nucella lapillus]